MITSDFAAEIKRRSSRKKFCTKNLLQKDEKSLPKEKRWGKYFARMKTKFRRWVFVKNAFGTRTDGLAMDETLTTMILYSSLSVELKGNLRMRKQLEICNVDHKLWMQKNEQVLPTSEWITFEENYTDETAVIQM